MPINTLRTDKIVAIFQTTFLKRYEFWLRFHWSVPKGPIDWQYVIVSSRNSLDSNKSQFTNHYIDVIMTTMASQITSLTVVYSTVYSNANQRKHQSFASLAFVWGIHRDRWIPRTKGQLRGKCFHWMTSSCEAGWTSSQVYTCVSMYKYCSDVIMSAMSYQITGISIVYSAADQRKHPSPASLAFVRRIHQWQVNSPR